MLHQYLQRILRNPNQPTVNSILYTCPLVLSRGIFRRIQKDFTAKETKIMHLTRKPEKSKGKTEIAAE